LATISGRTFRWRYPVQRAIGKRLADDRGYNSGAVFLQLHEQQGKIAAKMWRKPDNFLNRDDFLQR
jgi:hypothetical protein